MKRNPGFFLSWGSGVESWGRLRKERERNAVREGAMLL